MGTNLGRQPAFKREGEESGSGSCDRSVDLLHMTFSKEK